MVKFSGSDWFSPTDTGFRPLSRLSISGVRVGMLCAGIRVSGIALLGGANCMHLVGMDVGTHPVLQSAGLKCHPKVAGVCDQLKKKNK